MKKVLITGITGQAGSYLADALVERGDKVYGMVRRVSGDRFHNIRHLLGQVELADGDMCDQTSIDTIIRLVNPDWIFNTAAQSHVHVSFGQPELTADITGMGVLRLLEAMRKFHPTARMLQFSSSEQWGAVLETPQRESTPFNPQSPYAVAKCFAHQMCQVYRKSYNLFVSCAINMNFEGENRGEEFVTRKITKAVARIARGSEEKLRLGNLEARRDWGYGRDYARGWIAMLDYKTPLTLLFSTGETHSVKDFAYHAFLSMGLDWSEHVEIDQALFRPAEVDLLLGDSTEARRTIGWEPTVKFKELVHLMVKADLERLDVKS